MPVSRDKVILHRPDSIKREFLSAIEQFHDFMQLMFKDAPGRMIIGVPNLNQLSPWVLSLKLSGPPDQILRAAGLQVRAGRTIDKNKHAPASHVASVVGQHAGFADAVPGHIFDDEVVDDANTAAESPLRSQWSRMRRRWEEKVMLRVCVIAAGGQASVID